MNSIRSVGRALAFEEERQRRALDEGSPLVQETRHFDEKSGATSSMRSKEHAFDYRYFPEPDLVPLEPSAHWVADIQKTLPELPPERRQRFVSEYGLTPIDVGVLTASSSTAAWFEDAARAYAGDPKKIVNWIIADLFGLLNVAGIELSACRIAPPQLAALVTMVDAGTISGTQAKVVLAEMFKSGSPPREIVRAMGMEQVSDKGAIEAVIDEAIAENPDVADKVRGGNPGPLGFLVGQVMRKMNGQANPKVVNEILHAKLLS